MADVVKALCDALRALEKAEKKSKRRANWDDPAARKEYVREYKRKMREKKIPADRVCPGCKKVKITNKSWVIRDGKARCRSCDKKVKP
jgi:hypothetical protein